MPQNSVTDSIDQVAARLLEANSRRFDENMNQQTNDFEARNDKFNADLDALAPGKPKASATENPSGTWFLARKAWAWLYRD